MRPSGTKSRPFSLAQPNTTKPCYSHETDRPPAFSWWELRALLKFQSQTIRVTSSWCFFWTSAGGKSVSTPPFKGTLLSSLHPLCHLNCRTPSQPKRLNHILSILSWSQLQILTLSKYQRVHSTSALVFINGSSLG